ncbi:MAG: 4Fe-4S binding protein [Desulfurococcaceae archaeon]
MINVDPNSSSPLDELVWVAIHGRGVWHTGVASTLARALSMAGIISGRDSYYYIRYDDSPERVNTPMIWYVVMGNPKVSVLLPEEPEPVGELFNAVVIMDSTMLLKETSQRASILDGLKNGGVIAVNTGLSPSQVIYLIKKYQLTRSWSGKLVVVKASEYHENIAFGLLGALLKALSAVDLDTALTALDALGIDGKAKDAAQLAYSEASATPVELNIEEPSHEERAEALEIKPGGWDIRTYRRYQKAFSEARGYEKRIKALPRWEALAPGLIEFGPAPGERNIGFKTAFSRFQAPVIDKSKCINCNLCHLYCPDGSVDFETISIDYNYCTGCGICTRVCPARAIKLVSELERLEGFKDPEVERLTLTVREYGF